MCKSKLDIPEYSDSYMVLTKGETLSPILFILFINDMEEHFLHKRMITIH